MNDKIVVKSMSSGKVIINSPNLRFKREWPKKNAKVSVDAELLKELLYEPGVEYMIKSGLLFIEDMDFKKEVGLEPEDAKQPVNIIPLDEKKMQRILKLMPASQVEAELTALNTEQKRMLTTYAIENELIMMDRVDMIKNICGVDLLKAVAHKKSNEEE